MASAFMLSRFLQTDYCTLGRLSLGARQWQTIERAWEAGPGIAGKVGRSRIPAGHYRLERHNTEAHPASWALVAPMLGLWHFPWEIPKGTVEGRSAVLIHPANFAHELLGCIAPGKEHKQVSNRWSVARSRDAMNEINQMLKGVFEVSVDVSDDFDVKAAEA